MINRVFIFSLFILPFYYCCQSNYQVNDHYKLSDDSISKFVDRLNSMSFSNVLTRKQISKFEELCISRSNYFKSLNNDFKIMGNGEINDFLQALTQYIVDCNKDYPFIGSYNVFVNRSPSVNAANLGEGILLINLGLLEKVNTLEELIFVISHEIAHDIMKHVQIKTEQNAILYTDNKFNKKLKKAAKQKYGNYTSSSSIALEKAAQLSIHSRNNETSADSIGVILASNSGVKTEDMISVLTLLKSSDELKQLKSSLSYYFKNSNCYGDGMLLPRLDADLMAVWSESSNLFFIPDSLRSHPNCDDRINRISSYSHSSNFNLHLKKEELMLVFFAIKDHIYNEFLHNLMEEDQLSLGLYYTLAEIENRKKDMYLQKLAILYLQRIAISIQDYSFTLKVEFPDKIYPKTYNEMLSLLHSMKSKEVICLFSNHLKELNVMDMNDDLGRLVIYYEEFLKNDTIPIIEINNYFYNNWINN